jgi:hypothetical protein
MQDQINIRIMEQMKNTRSRPRNLLLGRGWVFWMHTGGYRYFRSEYGVVKFRGNVMVNQNLQTGSFLVY